MDRESPGEFHRVERSYGKFLRRFPLPSTASRDAVAARYHDGVLEVSLARRGHEEARAIRVSVR